MVNLIRNVIDLIGYFGEVAVGDPVSAALLAFGFLFVVVPSIVFFGLAAGGIGDWIIPDTLGQSPPRKDR